MRSHQFLDPKTKGTKKDRLAGCKQTMSEDFVVTGRKASLLENSTSFDPSARCEPTMREDFVVTGRKASLLENSTRIKTSADCEPTMAEDFVATGRKASLFENSTSFDPSAGYDQMMMNEQSLKAAQSTVQDNSQSIILEEKVQEFRVKFPSIAIIIQNHPTYQTLRGLPIERAERIVSRVVKSVIEEYPKSGCPIEVKVSWEPATMIVDKKELQIIPILISFPSDFKTNKIPFRLNFNDEDVSITSCVIDFKRHPITEFNSLSLEIMRYKYDMQESKIYRDEELLTSRKRVIRKLLIAEESKDNEASKKRVPSSPTKSHLKRRMMSYKRNQRKLRDQNEAYKNKLIKLEQENQKIEDSTEYMALENQKLSKERNGLEYQLKKVKLTPNSVFQRQNEKENTMPTGFTNSGLNFMNIR